MIAWIGACLAAWAGFRLAGSVSRRHRGVRRLRAAADGGGAGLAGLRAWAAGRERWLMADRMRLRLRLAGRPEGDWALARAAQVGLGVLAGALAGAVGYGLQGAAPALGAAAAAALGARVPPLLLEAEAAARQRGIRAALPEALELLAICLEAGLTPPAAVKLVSRHLTGPAAACLSGCDREFEAGIPLADALFGLERSTGVGEFAALAQALLRSQALGTPAAGLLRALAGEMRLAARHAAQVRIGQLPTRLTLVTVFFFMPPLFVLTVLPNILTLWRNW